MTKPTINDKAPAPIYKPYKGFISLASIIFLSLFWLFGLLLIDGGRVLLIRSNLQSFAKLAIQAQNQADYVNRYYQPLWGESKPSVALMNQGQLSVQYKCMFIPQALTLSIKL